MLTFLVGAASFIVFSGVLGGGGYLLIHYSK